MKTLLTLLSAAVAPLLVHGARDARTCSAASEAGTVCLAAATSNSCPPVCTPPPPPAKPAAEKTRERRTLPAHLFM